MPAPLPTLFGALRAVATLAVPAVLGLGAGCSKAPTPAIGFAYNWIDDFRREFMQSELDRTRPPGGDSIRLVALDGGVTAYAPTPLGAEIQRATRFVNDPSMVAAVGPGGSREAMQVAPVYANGRRPDLVPAASSLLLRSAGAYSFMLSADNGVQGAFLAAFADTVLRAKRVAIFYVPDEYGVGLSTSVERDLRRRAVAVLDRAPVRFARECSSENDRLHYARIADQLARRGEPDAVVLVARTVVAACLIYALRGRWPTLQILAGDGVYLDNEVMDRAGPRAEGVYLVAYWHPATTRPASREFAARYRARTGRAARHSEAVFLDAVMLAATAIREVGADRAAVTAYLRSLGVTRPPYEGITGPLSFAPDARHELLMTRISGDSSVIVGRR
jgi:ABC-type branched-subunit amino acid transport system substrate-binding protein